MCSRRIWCSREVPSSARDALRPYDAWSPLHSLLLVVTRSRLEDDRQSHASSTWLAALVDDPGRAGEVPVELVSVLVLRIAGILAALSTRAGATDRVASEVAGDNGLLDASETARRLAVSRDWVYRYGKTLPFAVRVGTRHLRFSSHGLERWLRARQGR
jgi:predicted DNA-binding transcriptional regulator AlpA